MAEAKMHVARRRIARTYGGVQWFKVERGEEGLKSRTTGKRWADRIGGWRASIPGTSLSVFRYRNTYTGKWDMLVEYWDEPFWCKYGSGKHWTHNTAATVAGASLLVKQLRREVMA